MLKCQKYVSFFLFSQYISLKTNIFLRIVEKKPLDLFRNSLAFLAFIYTFFQPSVPEILYPHSKVRFLDSHIATKIYYIVELLKNIVVLCFNIPCQ